MGRAGWLSFPVSFQALPPEFPHRAKPQYRNSSSELCLSRKLFILQGLTSALSRLHLFPSVHHIMVQLTSKWPERPSPQRCPLVSLWELQAVPVPQSATKNQVPKLGLQDHLNSGTKKNELKCLPGAPGFSTLFSDTGTDATAEAGPSARRHCSKIQEPAVAFHLLFTLTSPFPLLPESLS